MGGGGQWEEGESMFSGENKARNKNIKYLKETVSSETKLVCSIQ